MALALTCTPIVTVAGDPLRALTVHTTVLFAWVLHEPFDALELRIVNCGSIWSRMVIVRAVGLLVKTEIEKLNCWPIAAAETEA